MADAPRSDSNAPHLKEPKPPFGMRKAAWRRIRWVGSVGVSLLLCLFAFRIITRPTGEPPAFHTLDGDRLPDFYRVVRVEESLNGCDDLSEVDHAPFYAMHPGHPFQGPAFRPCSGRVACEAVMADPSTAAAPPAILRPQEDASAQPEWQEWLDVPTILAAQEGSRSGQARRDWQTGDRCFLLERHSMLTRTEESYTLETRVLVGQATCPEIPEVRCVARRVVRMVGTR